MKIKLNVSEYRSIEVGMEREPDYLKMELRIKLNDGTYLNYCSGVKVTDPKSASHAVFALAYAVNMFTQSETEVATEEDQP